METSIKLLEFTRVGGIARRQGLALCSVVRVTYIYFAGRWLRPVRAHRFTPHNFQARQGPPLKQVVYTFKREYRLRQRQILNPNVFGRNLVVTGQLQLCTNYSYISSLNFMHFSTIEIEIRHNSRLVE